MSYHSLKVTNPRIIMENKNEGIEDVVEVPEVTLTKDAEGNDTTDWKAIAEMNRDLALKNRGIAQRYKTKSEKAKEILPVDPVSKNEAKPDDNRLLEKAFLRSAGISKEKEIELALTTAKKWGVSVDSLVDDEDFQLKLDKLRTQESNEIATSGVRGGAGKSQAKLTPEYWIAKGVPPTAADIPDRKTRVQIAKAFLSSAKTNKTFYND